MGDKFYLTYTGIGPGQAHQIERCGYVFTRGLVTEVDPEVFEILEKEKGFKKSSKKEIDDFEKASEPAQAKPESQPGPPQEGVTDG